MALSFTLNFVAFMLIALTVTGLVGSHAFTILSFPLWMFLGIVVSVSILDFFDL